MPEIEIWSVENCPRCETVKSYLMSCDLSFTEKSLAALRKGEIEDSEALVELAINDGIAPLIHYNGIFVTESELRIVVERKRR